MPAKTIIASGGEYKLYGDSVRTYDELPIATYAINFNPMEGYSLVRTDELSSGGEKVYGTHKSRVARIISGYRAMDRSLGIILSGNKGMGKSLMIRMLAEQARVELGLPTILVQAPTPGIASFIDELGECLVVFDEFEKVFGDEELQSQFLGLFDGMSTTKRLYAISANSINRLSPYFRDRPGRFHYHMEFKYPSPEDVKQYLADQAPHAPKSEIDRVVDFSRRYELNFDHLRAISFELRRGEPFREVIGDLNIKKVGELVYELLAVREDGSSAHAVRELDLFNEGIIVHAGFWDERFRLAFDVGDIEIDDASGQFILPHGKFTVQDMNAVDDEDYDDDDEDAPEKPTEEEMAKRTAELTFSHVKIAKVERQLGSF